MIKRRDVLKMGAAGAFGVALANVGAAMAGAAVPSPYSIAPGSGELARLTTADLRALPPLRPPRAITRTGRTKTFTLALATAAVEPLPGHSVPVRAVNGLSPGPTLRVVEGDMVEVTVVNRLTMGATIHWHGVPVPFLMDGAGMISQQDRKSVVT